MRVRDKNHRDTARSCTDLRVPTGTLYRGKTADKLVGDVDIVLTADARELQQGLLDLLLVLSCVARCSIVMDLDRGFALTPVTRRTRSLSVLPLVVNYMAYPE